MKNKDIEQQLFDVDNISEAIIDIDMDAIDDASLIAAKDMVDNLSQFYYDDEFLEKNPNFKKRIDAELESLRVLIKMRKADEEAHDALINAIVLNSNNASLYRSLTEIQKTIISITTKMDEIVLSLNNMMKGYQLELNFDNDNEEEQNPTNTHRGTKEFIKQMINESKKGE